MSITYDDAVNDHTWFHPSDVLTIVDSEYNVVAYGIPVDQPKAEPEDA